MCFAAGGIAHKNWAGIANETVKNWVKFGVPIPFNSVPNDILLPNHKLSQVQVRFVDQEIKDLLASGAIEYCDNPRCISPIGVVDKKSA